MSWRTDRKGVRNHGNGSIAEAPAQAEALGNRERFEIAISDQGFREWARNRVLLSASGYPDRPPEIDTAHYRAWNLYPGLFDDEFLERLTAAVEAAGL